MESLSRLAGSRPIATLVFAIIIVVLGQVSWNGLAIDLFPDLQSPTVLVSVSSGERPAQEMERIYGERIEQLLFTVRGITSLNQIARSGRLVSRVTFDYDVDIDVALVDVNRALSSIAADSTIDAVKVRRFDPRQLPVLVVGLTAKQSSLALAELRTIAKRQLAPALEQLEGVAEARITGGRVKEVRVQVDPQRLKAHGLTIETVAQRISANNVDYNAGTLEEFDKVMLVRGLSRFVDPIDVSSVVVKYINNGNIVSSVKVADIAEVKVVDAKINHLVRVDGTEGIGLSIYKESGANTVAVSKTLREAVERLNKDLPNMKITLIADQAGVVEDAIADVKSAALFGIILAVGVLVVFLRSPGPIVIVAVSVPVSLYAAVFAMSLADQSLNLMTLAGLALGAGMLVDNAIVVIESIFRRRADGYGPLDAAAKGTAEVGPAIVSSTLTTCVVFLPVLFIQGMAAKLVAGIAFTVVVSMLASLLVAIFLIPALSVYLLPKDQTKDVDPGSEKLQKWVYYLLGRPYLVLMSTVALVAAAIFSLSLLGTELLPPSDPSEFNLRVVSQPGLKIQATDEVVDNIEAILAKAADGDLVAMMSEVGRLDDDERVIREEQTAQNIAELKVRLKPQGRTAGEVVASAKAAVDELYGVDVDWQLNTSALSQAVGISGPPIVIEVQGESLDELRKAADLLYNKLQQAETVWNVQTSFDGAPAEIHLKLKSSVADMMGVTIDSINSVVSASLEGVNVTTLMLGDESQQIVLKLPDVNLASIGHQTFLTPNGQWVSIDDVADISIKPGAREILRRNQRRIAEVTALIKPDQGLPQAKAEVQQLIDTVQLPVGIKATLAGEEQQRIKTIDDLQWAAILAVLLVLMVLAGTFESLLHPLTILTAIPLSLIGVAMVLVPQGQPIGIMAMLGFIVLVGIAVNDAILLLDATRQLKQTGMDTRSALAKAAAIRLRPIIMTTATTALALLPLALGTEDAAQLRSPLAWTVVGGILSATVGCLLVIPCVYLLVDKLKFSTQSND